MIIISLYYYSSHKSRVSGTLTLKFLYYNNPRSHGSTTLMGELNLGRKLLITYVPNLEGVFSIQDSIYLVWGEAITLQLWVHPASRVSSDSESGGREEWIEGKPGMFWEGGL